MIDLTLGSPIIDRKYIFSSKNVYLFLCYSMRRHIGHYSELIVLYAKFKIYRTNFIFTLYYYYLPYFTTVGPSVIYG